MSEVTLKKIKSCRAACMDAKGFEAMKPAFDDTSAFILANALEFGEPSGVVVYENSPGKVGWEHCVYKVCVPVKGRSTLAGEQVKIEKLPELKTAACLVHKGSYDRLPEAWGRVCEWISENGYAATAVGREAYLNDCKLTPAEELLTEIQVPVKAVNRSG